MSQRTFLLFRRPLWLLVLFTALFDLLFWRQALGLNATLFTVAVLLAVVGAKGWTVLPRTAKLVAAGALWAALLVVVQGTVLSLWALFASLVVFVGAAQDARLRTATSAALQWLSGAVRSPLVVWDLVTARLRERTYARKGTRWVGLAFVPLLVFGLFLLLYSGGNSRFQAVSAGFFDGVWNLLHRFFSDMLTPHTIFLVFGALVSCGFVLNAASDGLPQYIGRLSDGLARTRVRRPKWQMPLALGALDREMRMGLLLLVLVNALLAVVNAIDIHWLWFGYTVPEGGSLKEFVHQGTWLLVVSILLGMAIILHLFRGNLNFHPRKKVLQRWAMLWLVQNFILGISVCLRNSYYIGFHGLAYKRIGVMVFLLLMLVGLITFLIKVRNQRTAFFLFRVNGWAAFVVLLGMATIDWDRVIARYNLTHSNAGEIDVDNYLALGDHALPLLYEHLDRIDAQIEQHRHNKVRWITTLDPDHFHGELDAARSRFLEQQAGRSWQSWTWADQRTLDALRDAGHVTSMHATGDEVR